MTTLTAEQFEAILSAIKQAAQDFYASRAAPRPVSGDYAAKRITEADRGEKSDIQFSDPVDSFAEALAIAQGEMETVVKLKAVNMNTKRGAVNYTYASLADIMRVCRVPLAKNGLSVAQQLLTDDQGRYVMKTLLLHRTGQWMRATSPIPFMGMPGDNATSAQAHGSLIAYARRYALVSILNIVTDDYMDDDGQQGQAQVEQLSQSTMQPIQETPTRQVVYDAVDDTPTQIAQQPAEASPYTEAYINYYNLLLDVKTAPLVAAIYTEAKPHLDEKEQKLFKRECARHFEKLGGKP